MTRPGPKLIKTLWGLAAGALAVPLLPPLSWLLLAGLVVAITLAVVERKRLGRVRVDHEEAPRHVLSLDEEEPIVFRISTDASRPVRMDLSYIF